MPRPGRACSSYLLQTDESAVLLDLGSGAFANLGLALDYPRLDAVIVSHMHADHFLDLVPLRYGLTYGPLLRESRLPVWLPPGGTRILRQLCDAFDSEGTGDFLNGVFALGEYDPSQTLIVEDVALRFAPALHFVNAFAIRAENSGAAITYSGDTAPCDAVVELARGSALFLCEASLGLGTEEGTRGHSSATEAGEMARRAGVGRLALTHYFSTCEPDELMNAAGATFGGPVWVVDDGMLVI